MNSNHQYPIDSNSILQKAYYLICLLYANKEISRQSDPEGSLALRSLENRFFRNEFTRLLIELAIAVRVHDDQMSNADQSDPKRALYFSLKAEVDRLDYTLFGDEEKPRLKLRSVCNKIIHSGGLKLSTIEGSEGHETDYAYNAGDDVRSISWRHYSGYVRLAEIKNGKELDSYLLDVKIFVTAVFEVFSGLDNH